MSHADVPPGSGPDADDRLVEDMLSFLNGGSVPDTPGGPPAGSPGVTRSWRRRTATVGPDARTPSPAGRDITPDRVIGPYRVVRWVDGGGMGEVFHARHRELPLEVALKTIRAGHDHRPGTRERFRVEAAAAASLDHPNVIKLYGFDEYAGELYIAMEWVPGGNLADRLAGKPMPPRAAAALVRTLAEAMAYAHAHGVLHRDLKPQNVLLTADGTPKVADFGLARILTDGDDRLTWTGAVMGTPAYMAPEQAAGRDRDVDGRTDVYALGAILYEALTGAPPFVGDSKDAVLKQVQESDAPRPSAAARGLPPDLEAVCLCCLAKAPAKRYATAAELAADLGRFLAGEPTVARPLSRLRRAAYAVRKRRRPIALAAVLAATAGGTVLLTPRPETEETRRAAQLKALATTLDAGGPVTLVGAQGPPRFGAVTRCGEDRTRFAVGEHGAFQVSSWADAMIELAPETRREAYRFRASVRHVYSDPGGFVGLYACDQRFPSPGGGENGWAAVLTYNDIFSAADVVRTAMASEAPRLLTPQVEATPNHANFQVLGRGEMAPGREWSPAGATVGATPFRLHRAAPAAWRVLHILVSPDGISARLDGLTAGSASTEAVVGWVTRWRDDAAALHPSPLWAGCDPRPAARGGLGLVVRQGTADFRDVVIEPLDP
ncbi:MAG: serine/threonine-protein kinase [Gemmataceae bacterium]